MRELMAGGETVSNWVMRGSGLGKPKKPKRARTDRGDRVAAETLAKHCSAPGCGKRLYVSVGEKRDDGGIWEFSTATGQRAWCDVGCRETKGITI